MAILHRAEITPTKLELIAGWLPGQPWYAGPGHPELESVGAYRFDDPLGEVGIETLLVRAPGGPILQVPLTYRGEQLPGAEESLIGTMEHSVLGRRWVYDACGDPVYTRALAAVVSGDAVQAEEFFEVDGRREVRAQNMGVTRADVTEATTEPTLLRVVDPTVSPPEPPALLGTWAGQEQPVPLATARVR